MQLSCSIVLKPLSESGRSVGLFKGAFRNGQKIWVLGRCGHDRKAWQENKNTDLMVSLIHHLCLFVSFLVSFLSIIAYNYLFFPVASQADLIIYTNMSDFYSDNFPYVQMLSNSSWCVWQWWIVSIQWSYAFSKLFLSFVNLLHRSSCSFQWENLSPPPPHTDIQLCFV